MTNAHNDQNTYHIVMAAGGTGGHMFPGSVVAEELIKRGHSVSLITDQRGAAFDQLFVGLDKKIIRAGNLSGGLVTRIMSLFAIAAGWWQARSFLKQKQADVVVGFGGYPAFPAMLAARMGGTPFCLHEQNAVMGRVNKAMAIKAAAIATSFENTQKVPTEAQSKLHLIGNPVRMEFRDVKDEKRTPSMGVGDMASTNKGGLHILVVGGSQGARILSDVVPEGVAGLRADQQQSLTVTQQCRPEDAVRVAKRYQELGVRASCPSFIEDMPAAFQKADLIIARAGALTVCEIAAAGKPAIFVPLAIAVDNHQYYNALALECVGGAIIIKETDFNADDLAQKISDLISDRDALTKMAAAAQGIDKPNAIESLADMILEVAHLKTTKTNKIKRVAA